MPTLDNVSLVIEERSYDDADVQRLVEAVQAEYVVRYGGPDEAHVDPSDFAPPTGLFLVGLLDGQPVAMGGWRRITAHTAGAAHTADTAELKRMFVIGPARRQGLSRVLLARLERTAAESGVQRMILNTGLEQPEAIALYESSGYTRIDGFGRYACAPSAVFYGKQLAEARDAAGAAAVSRG